MGTFFNIGCIGMKTDHKNKRIPRTEEELRRTLLGMETSDINSIAIMTSLKLARFGLPKYAQRTWIGAINEIMDDIAGDRDGWDFEFDD